MSKCCVTHGMNIGCLFHFYRWRILHMNMKYLGKPTFYSLHSNFFATPQHFCFPTSYTFSISLMCWAPLAPLSVYGWRTIYCIMNCIMGCFFDGNLLFLDDSFLVRGETFWVSPPSRMLTRYYANLMHVVKVTLSSAVHTALSCPASTVSPSFWSL